MSMMKTLAKVAIGIAVAKGVGSMVSKGRTASSGGSGDGGLFGGAHSPGQAQAQTQSGGLEGMMRDVLAGGRSSSGGGGGLGGALGDALGGGGASGGGAGGLGGLGGLIEGLIGGAAGGAAGGGLTRGAGGFGEKLNDAFGRMDEPAAPPTPQEEDAAGLMLKAMIQAAKSDGNIDEAEKQKLLANLGDVSPAEREFVNREISAPVDVQGLARAVPKGMESQVYVMSVMGIDLDNQREAQYLHELAQAMGIGQQDVNHIHTQLGVPKLYT